MRSPWKVIADFASRRKPKLLDAPSDEVPAQADLKEEEATIPTGRQPGNAALATSLVIDDAEIGILSERPTTALGEVQLHAGTEEARGAESAASGPGDEPASQVTTVEVNHDPKRVAPSKIIPNIKPTRVPRSKHGERKSDREKRAAENSVAAERTAFLRMSALDFDIQSLRSQLNEKLREQNAEPRHLLDRYGDD